MPRHRTAAAIALLAVALAGCSTTTEEFPATPPVQALAVSVTSHQDGQATGARMAVVEGEVDGGPYQASVRVTNLTTGREVIGTTEQVSVCAPAGACRWPTRWSATVPLELGDNLLSIVATTFMGRGERRQHLFLERTLLVPWLSVDVPAGWTILSRRLTAAAAGTLTGTSLDAATIRWVNATTGGAGAAPVDAATRRWSVEIPLAPCVENQLTLVADNGYGVGSAAVPAQITRTFGRVRPAETPWVSDTPAQQVTWCQPNVEGTITWSNLATGVTGTTGTLLPGRAEWGFYGREVPLVLGENPLELEFRGADGIRTLETFTVRFEHDGAFYLAAQPASTSVPAPILRGLAPWLLRATWWNAATAQGGEIAPGEGGLFATPLPVAPGPNPITLTAYGAGLERTLSWTLDHVPPPASDLLLWGSFIFPEPPETAAPVALGGLAGVRQVAAGTRRAFALLDDGRIASLGEGVSPQPDGTPVPFAIVEGVPAASAVAAGSGHGCALTVGGEVWCWGGSDPWVTGCEMGCPPGVPSTTPHRVELGVAARLVASAQGLTCAALQAAGGGGGEVRCWGDMGGIFPGVIQGLVDPTALALGVDGVCGIRPGGTVACAPRRYPLQATDVPGLAGVVALAAGAHHTCAARADGSAWCWGGNEAGQLGDGTTTARPEPVQVSGLDDVVALAAGLDHSCALRAGGKVSCWGANDHGQLGDGTVAPNHRPVEVPGLVGVSALAAEQWKTLVVRR